MNVRFKTLIVLAALVTTTVSAGDLERLARDLERALGKGRVEIRSEAPPSARRPTGRLADAALRSDPIVEAMNRERAEYGLAPLRLNEQLSLAARDRIHDMFEQRYFDHVAPDGTQPFVWVARRGYSYRLVGENLAVGYASAGAVVNGWMRSPGHRENILKRGFDEVGIAVASGAPTRRFSGPTIVAIYGSR